MAAKRSTSAGGGRSGERAAFAVIRDGAVGAVHLWLLVVRTLWRVVSEVTVSSCLMSVVVLRGLSVLCHSFQGAHVHLLHVVCLLLFSVRVNSCILSLAFALGMRLVLCYPSLLPGCL